MMASTTYTQQHDANSEYATMTQRRYGNGNDDCHASVSRAQRLHTRGNERTYLRQRGDDDRTPVSMKMTTIMRPATRWPIITRHGPHDTTLAACRNSTRATTSLSSPITTRPPVSPTPFPLRAGRGCRFASMPVPGSITHKDASASWAISGKCFPFFAKTLAPLSHRNVLCCRSRL